MKIPTLNDLKNISPRELGYHAHECEGCNSKYPCYDISCAELDEALCADCAEGTYDPFKEHRDDEARALQRQQAVMKAGRELGQIVRKKLSE